MERKFSSFVIYTIIVLSLQINWREYDVFVAYNLAKLAEETLNCTSEVLDMRDSESKRSLLRHLANSHPVLVPYPFCRHHWLIPTCLVITTDEIHGKWGGAVRENILYLLGLKCTCNST